MPYPFIIRDKGGTYNNNKVKDRRIHIKNVHNIHRLSILKTNEMDAELTPPIS